MEPPPVAAGLPSLPNLTRQDNVLKPFRFFFPYRITNKNPLRLNATLSSLPLELLSLVANNLDTESALALARVSKQVGRAAEARIWRDISISVQSRETGGKSVREWDSLEYGAVLNEQEVALIKRLSDMQDRGNKRTWGYTTSLKMMASVESMPGAMDILEAVRLKLRVLETMDRGAIFTFSDRRGKPNLDSRIITLNLTFPALTTLRLCQGSIRDIQAIPSILNACPNILSLSLSHIQVSTSRSSDDLLPIFKPFQTPTKIRELDLTIYTCLNHGDTSSDGRSTLISILENCPQTRKLTLDYSDRTHILHPGIGGETYGLIMDVVETLECLVEVVWGGESIALSPGSGRVGNAHVPTFERVEEFTYMDKWTAAFGKWPDCPTAHNITINTLLCECPPCISTAQVLPVLAIPSLFASRLRANPKLVSIRDQPSVFSPRAIESFIKTPEGPTCGNFAAMIRSITFGDKEILHIRIRSIYVPVDDVPWPNGLNVPICPDHRVEYTALDGSLRAMLFEKREKAAWYHMTDLDGEVVPLEVLEDMRLSQGGKKGYWDGRNIVVEERVWEGAMQKWRGIRV